MIERSHLRLFDRLRRFTGVVGFALVVVSVGLIGTVLVRHLWYEGRRWRRYGRRDVACVGVDPYAVPLAGLLALVAMVVHSFGDFNLQMPATGWVLAVMVAIPLAGGVVGEKSQEKSSRGAVPDGQVQFSPSGAGREGKANMETADLAKAHKGG